MAWGEGDGLCVEMGPWELLPSAWLLLTLFSPGQTRGEPLQPDALSYAAES